MIKHYIDIFTNTYIIEKDDVIVFSIELNKDGKDVHIRGIKNEYIGNIEDLYLLLFSE
jgi:hypothetical protein